MKTFGFCHSFYLGLSEKKNTGTKHLNKKQICCNFIYLLWSLEQMASYTCSEEEKQQIIQNKALAILSATWLYWIKNKTATDFNSVCYKKRDNYIQNQTISNKIYFFLIYKARTLICMYKDLLTTERQGNCIYVWITLILGKFSKYLEL